MKTTRLAPIAALGGLCAAAFAAGGGCQGPESFHMVGTVPTAGVQFGQGGVAGGSASGGAAAGGRSGSGGRFGGFGGLLGMGTGGSGSGGTAGGASASAGGAGGRPQAAGGAPSAGGSSGVAGAPASGGAGGAVAGGGAGGAAGGAGGATVGAGGAAGGAGGSCATCGVSVTIECRNDMPGDSTAMHAEIWLVNASSQPLPLGQLRLRYYYVNEGGPIMLEIFDKAFKNPDGTGYRSVQATFTPTNGKLTTPPMDYTDIAITTAATLDDTVPFYFKMSLHDANHSKLDLTNDYSNGPAAISTCPHIVAYVGDAVVAGIPPGP